MLKSLSSLLLYVSNPVKSARFYQDLGFLPSKEAQDISEVRLNWFKIQFVDQDSAKENPEFTKEAFADPKGSGLYIYISVENVDEYYQQLKSKNIETSSEPRDWSWGNREFVVRDPDGYKLVFYQSLKN